MLTVAVLLCTSGTLLSQHRASRTDDARIDPATGTARAIYRPRFEKPVAGGPDEIARAFLRSEPRIGWDGDSKTLRPVGTVESSGGTHVTYQQYVDDIPVIGGVTRVSIGRDLKPTFVSSGFRPELLTSDVEVAPGVDRNVAEELAVKAVEGGDAAVNQASLAVLPGEPARLVWKSIVWPEIGGEWQVLVDAISGEVVAIDELTLHRSIRERNRKTGRLVGHLSASSLQESPSVTRVLATGKGMVFDPDPLATSGMPYAPPYVDSDDADVAELNAERISVDLLGISQFADNRYRLAGPYIHVVGRRAFGVANYDPPAELDPEAFNYTRSDDRFEAVMVYYHIDKSQRWVQALGFDNIRNAPIEVNPFGEGTIDNSNYYPSQNFIGFGSGGIDDAEDAFVIWHEYGHALLDEIVPDLLLTFEGRSIHEGWGDYWAASYERQLIESGAIPETDWRRFYRWDGNAAFTGRQLPEFARYPDDLNLSSHHLSGLVLASALMGVWDHLGRDLTDQLSLEAQHYLAASATMPDLAEAFVRADIELYGGEHADVIVAVFHERGLVDAERYGPIITHDRIRDTEQVGGVIEVVAQVSGVIDPIGRASLTYIIDGVETTSDMVAVGDGSYSAQILLPPRPTLVDYYIVAVDENGREVRFPEGAPNEVLNFQAGPDTETPTIEHVPIVQTSVFGWPPTINAKIVDNIGIDTAFVEYAIDDLDSGSEIDAGGFELEPDGERYTGRFPELPGLIDGDEVVNYRIMAVDRSKAANKAVVPPVIEPAFEFFVSAEGMVASFDFEGSSGDVITTGAWEHGSPSLGVHYAHSGSDVWATGLGRAYPGFPGTAELVLPAFNLSGLSFAWLEFWHWYDVEHDGTAIPGSEVDATLWDGGVVEVSTDGGASWTSVTPQGGYDGTVESGAGNPLEGREAFGGFSFGWRRELVMIPGGPDVRVRFVFGHDVSNEEASRDYAGWMIDDVSIRVDRPEDNEAPRIVEEPLAVTEAEAGSPIGPAVSVRVTDNVGVGSAEVFYELSGSVAQESGSARLAQSGTDPQLFSGRLPITAGSTAPGSMVKYRISVGDFDGNSVESPTGDARYRIEYVFVAREDQLSSVTASGGWSSEGALGWTLSGQTHTGGVSALVFTPFDLPTDAADIRFELIHDYRLAPPAEANVRASTDAGATWGLIEPVEGYPAAQTGFQGQSTGESSVFRLNDYAGQQVQLRIELTSPRQLAGDDYWHIGQASTVFRAEGDRFTVPRTLELHPNFPNPFTGSTTLSYTIPEPSSVTIEVYNVLGRRVALIVNESMEPGTYSTRWEAGGLPGGTYFIRLDTDSGQDVKAVSVIK